MNVPPAPVANFVGTPLSGGRPHVVQLTDTSTNVPTSWAWTFGDGETSTLQNPSHTYVAAGTYTVTLTATNAGGSDTETKVGYVTVTELQPPTAAFSANVTTGTAPLAVQFTDASTNEPTSWSWTFGDGGTSMLQSPGHTYAAAGTYTVSLTATNAAGSDAETKTGYITVTVPPPVADFSAIPTSGTAPHVVQFTDTSTNGPTSWAWTFGDGGTSILQNPSHTYASAGIYTVTLTATNAGGSDTETKTGYITVEAAPTLYNIKLWANKSGYLQNGGYLQFRVTDRWSSYITLDSVGRRDLDDEEIVRLTIGSDGSGGINMGGTISNFDFDDVTLSINGLPVGTGGVSSIQINSYDNLVSTLTLNVPPVDAQTDFQVVGGESINGIDDHQIIITNIKPLSGSTVYLDTSGATVNYEGGAEAYQLILPPQHTSTLQVSAKRNNENLNLGFSYWGDIGGTQTTPFTIQRTQGDSSFTVTIRAADGYTHGSWRPFQYWKLDGITQYGNPLVVTVPDSAERTLIAYY
ncbi:PKD domain protein [anaerobic digester metagenome]